MHTPKSKGVPQESPGLLRVIQPRVPKHQHGRRALWSPPRTRKAVRLTSVLRYASLYLSSKCGLLLHRQLCKSRCRCAETVTGGRPTERVALDQKTFEGAVYGGRSRLSIAARRAVTESVSRQLNRTPTKPMLPHAKQGSQTIIILVLNPS